MLLIGDSWYRNYNIWCSNNLQTFVFLPFAIAIYKMLNHSVSLTTFLVIDPPTCAQNCYRLDWTVVAWSHARFYIHLSACACHIQHSFFRSFLFWRLNIEAMHFKSLLGIQNQRASLLHLPAPLALLSTMFPSSYHHEIPGVITNDRSDGHAKGQGQRSKVIVTEVKTQLSRFRTITPVWIHTWWWNDTQGLMLLRRVHPSW